MTNNKLFYSLMPQKLLVMKFPFYFLLSKGATVMLFTHSYLENIGEKRGLLYFPLF